MIEKLNLLQPFSEKSLWSSTESDGNEVHPDSGLAISFPSTNQEEYNSPITKREVVEIINQLKDGTPGIDNIHNAFIRNLPEEFITIIVHLYNSLYREHYPFTSEDSSNNPYPKEESSKN